MSLALTAPLMVTVSVVAYLWGRLGRMPSLGTTGPAAPTRPRPPRVPLPATGVRGADSLGLGPIGLSAGRPAADRALADLERRVARLERARVRATAEAAAARAVADDADGSGAAGAPAEVVDHRAAAHRWDKHRARRHYEALASEIASERRMADHQERATGTGAGAARVLRMSARHASAPRVRRYPADQRA